MANDALNSQINTGSVWAPYQEFIYTIPAGGYQRVNYVTDNFVLLEVTASNALEVNFGGAMNQTNFTAGVQYRLEEAVPNIQLHNRSDAPVTVHFALGVGEVRDNRLTLANTTLTISETYQAMTVKNSGLLASNALYYTVTAAAEKMLIQNVGTSSIFIGAADGFEISSGGSMELPLNGTFSVYQTTGKSPQFVVGAFAKTAVDIEIETILADVPPVTPSGGSSGGISVDVDDGGQL